MPRHSDAAKAAFRGLVPEAPGVEVKPMFGSVGAFVNGNMFAGLFGEQMGVKLDAAGLAEASALAGSGPFGPAERPMNGWVALPVDLADDQTAQWFSRALEHIATLPPKVKKAPAKK
jgi:TfoX/Sxy family transcriptional regulator of competence genes